MPGELAELVKRYRNSVKMADMLGLPRPVMPQQMRRKRMPQSQAAQKGIESVAQRLFSKLLMGEGVPGEDVVPYALLPNSVRSQIPMEAPPIGFPSQKLENDEAALLQQLLQQGAAERPQTEATAGELEKARRIMEAAARERRLARLREIQGQ